MPEYELVSKHGVVKERAVTNIDPSDEDAMISLLRRRASAKGLGSEAKIRVKARKGGWRTYQAK
jgi:hypothetical protein